MSDEIFTLYYKPDGSKDKFGEIIAYVVMGVQGMMNIRNVTAGYDHDLFFKDICVYASTPVASVSRGYIS